MATISVAMAAYNGEKFIRKQLDSILQQLKAEDEIVISYDKSNDNTLKIIKDFEKNDSHVKVVINPNPGLFNNFENAIRNCSNDFIFICDQDDIWDEHKREVVMKIFRDKDVDMVIHNGVHIDENDKVISKDFFTIFHITKNKFTNFVKPRYSGCCIAFTRKLTEIIVPIPHNVGAYDHWIGMIGQKTGKVVFCDKVLLYHRLHGDNYTTPTRKLSVVLKARWNLLMELYKRSRKISEWKEK